MNAIHELRKKGYKVRVHHFRYLRSDNQRELFPRNQLNGKAIWPKGGRTEMSVRLPSGIELSSVAQCSREDTFNRKRANQICLGRIGKQIVIKKIEAMADAETASILENFPPNE